MVFTEEPAKRHLECSGYRRQDALVYGFAGLEALNRAREDVTCPCQLVDAVATSDAETEDTRRQWLRGWESVMTIAPLRIR